jgi:hypothetical protein
MPLAEKIQAPKGTYLSPVLDPLGVPMSVHDLPASNTKRWVIRRKAKVVAGVRGGLITLEEACTRYNLSIDEFLSWQRLLNEHGIDGLRATRNKD